MNESKPSPEMEPRRQVRLRVRPDLTITPQVYEGCTYYVVKDPAGLEYFRCDEYDYLLLRQMNGEKGLEDIRLAFEERFRPRRLSLEDLEAFARQLAESGLATYDLAQSGQVLFENHRKRRRRKILRAITSIFYISIPLGDPDPVVSRVYRRISWLLRPLPLALGVFAMLVACLTVAVHFEEFQRRLPSAPEFFRFKNLLLLWIALGLVKALHELGHGLACKALGGEVHEAGALFMCLSPCLYLDVSDAWTFPDKWNRIIVGLAGIYVELLIAALATFLWWNTSPGPLQGLCLSLMIVCSLNTVVFNGNPLLRFDGYYVFADWLEIPNLREQATRQLHRFAMVQCLGMEVPPEPVTTRRQLLFVTYAIASYLYGWIVSIGAILFFANFLPVKLRALSVLLAIFTGASMIGWPLYSFLEGIWRRGKLPDLSPGRTGATIAVVLALLGLFLFLPLPVSRIRQTGIVQLQPEAVRKVFVSVSGSLERLHIRDGQQVRAGDLLAEFRSRELESALEEARSEYAARAIQARALRQQADEVSDPQRRQQLEVSFAQAEGERRVLAAQVAARERALQMLVIRAPRSGVILGAPRREEVGKRWEKEEAIPLCSIGDPMRLRGVVPVSSDDYRLLRDDVEKDGVSATVRVEGWGARTWGGRIAALPQSEAREVPLALTTQGGGRLPARPGARPGTMTPLTQQFLVGVDLLEAERDGIWPGTRTQIKIHCRWRSCAWWLWRALSSQFDLGLM